MKKLIYILLLLPFFSIAQNGKYDLRYTNSFTVITADTGNFNKVKTDTISPLNDPQITITDDVRAQNVGIGGVLKVETVDNLDDPDSVLTYVNDSVRKTATLGFDEVTGNLGDSTIGLNTVFTEAVWSPDGTLEIGNDVDVATDLNVAGDADIGGSLDVDGGVEHNYNIQGSNYNALNSDYHIEMTNAGDTCFLPAGSGSREYHITNVSTGTITIDCDGVEQIGNTTATLSNDIAVNSGDSVGLVWNGTVWRIF